MDRPSAAERRAEVEEFLYREALLLDERRFGDWLALLTDDVRYLMPTQLERGGRTFPTVGEGDAAGAELAYLEDDRRTLAQRVERLESGMAWAEVPPSRTARVVANVLVDGHGEDTDTLRARSVLVLHRHRSGAGGSEVEQFWAHRDDTLRRVDGDLRLAARTIRLAATSLPGRNLAVFL